ncbi:MAG: class I SAM-dependent methyltransferase [Desulfobacterales bacterium]|jgi:2-polyprenyl-3-methyl-5-hydroxy-6-metoxy-1,4-benzoquinol methylase
MKESEIRPRELFNRYLELARKDIDRFFSDPSQFLAVACPGCGSQACERALVKLKFRYVLCSECGSLYLSPRPTADMYAVYYQGAESVKFWSSHFFRETAEARRQAIFKPRAQLVAEWLKKVKTAPAANQLFVDIGSGYAIFLQEVERLGLFEQVVGIEPEANLAQVGRDQGFTIVEKNLEAIDDGEISADFATAFEVLEHVFSPLEFLTAAGRILRPGGILMLTTLTVSGFDIQVLWEHSKSIYPPHHINLLSARGMRELVARSGLQLVDLSTPGELDVDIVRNIQRENPGIQLPRFIASIIDAPAEVRTRFQHFLKENELSSHIRVMVSR